jgi:hypothetical protein
MNKIIPKKAPKVIRLRPDAVGTQTQRRDAVQAHRRQEKVKGQNQHALSCPALCPLAGRGKGLRGRVGVVVAANARRANGGGFLRWPRGDICGQAAAPKAAKAIKPPATAAKCKQDASGKIGMA